MITSFQVTPFKELTPDTLYAILKLRQEVFVVEQVCPYLDCDGIDPACLHVMGYANSGEIIATARIAPPDVIYNGYASIGRVVIAQNFRGQDLGRKLMREAMSQCNSHYPGKDIKIMAQTYLKDFYLRLGFQPTGEAFLEDEIPHLVMVCSVGAS